MSATYAHISEEEFENYLEDVADFEKKDIEGVNENVYDINVPHDELVVRIFSTIEAGSSRGVGQDAIRTVLWHTGQNAPVSGRKKTLRVGPSDSNPHGWKANLTPKIADLLFNWRDEYTGDCPECSGVLSIRDGKYGKFLGCSNYPNCYHTEDFDDN